ncbi:MAG: hypothetical protein ACTHMC_09810 [Pseudobacter sp.]|uniref:hypothetical protein n=1 Tax=Pseudobacter sp. TaxID=2045420 RepID=UPI003F7EA2E7
MQQYKLGDLVSHPTDLAPFKVVGIRENELEIEGDFSGGTHNVCQIGWVPIEDISPYYGVNEPQSEGGLQWVKASANNLPAPHKVVPCKYTPDSPDPRKDTELHWGFVCNDGTWSRGWRHDQVEWLDESSPSTANTEERYPGEKDNDLKDLIIHGIEEGAAQWENRARDAEERIRLLAGRLLEMRDEMVKGDLQGAYHILYSIANPMFDSLKPWSELEKLAANTEEGAAYAEKFHYWMRGNFAENITGDMFYRRGEHDETVWFTFSQVYELFLTETKQ